MITTEFRPFSGSKPKPNSSRLWSVNNWICRVQLVCPEQPSGLDDADMPILNLAPKFWEVKVQANVRLGKDKVILGSHSAHAKLWNEMFPGNRVHAKRNEELDIVVRYVVREALTHAKGALGRMVAELDPLELADILHNYK